MFLKEYRNGVLDLDKLVLKNVSGEYVWTARVVGVDGVARYLTVSTYYRTEELAYRDLRDLRMD